MRHKKTLRKLGRKPSHRKSLIRNLVTDFLKSEKMHTTHAKAKTAQRVAEKYITIGKVDNVHNRRKAYAFINCKKTVHKLFTEIGPRFVERPGGYTRVLKTMQRHSDASQMALLTMIDYSAAEVETEEEQAEA